MNVTTNTKQKKILGENFTLWCQHPCHKFCKWCNLMYHFGLTQNWKLTHHCWWK